MTASTTPNEYTTMYCYYSAPASPPGYSDNLGSDFEFETSKSFTAHLHSQSPKYHRGDSLPPMAFADDLFLNGLVMPLKLPPRLQYSQTEFNCFTQRSSPRTVCRIPFARKSSWNDDFDPFTVALQKVREEKRGRNSHHRRSRSYSPFRAISKSPDCSNQDLGKGSSPMEAPPSYSGPLDFKGSAYARWVRDQTGHGLSPKSPRRYLSRLKMEQDGSDKPILSEVGKKHRIDQESTVQKLKGFLTRYASFRRENSESKTRSDSRKLSYFGRLSFKFKGNVQSNGKKNTNMAVVQYKPSIAHCIGYGVGSPIKVK